MKAKISEANKRLFSPGYRTRIAGKQVSVLLQDFLDFPSKYIGTGISFLYENEAELKKHFSKIKNSVVAKKLDMGKAERGTSFNKSASGKPNVSKEVAEMLKKQGTRTAKVKASFLRDQAAKKAAKKKATSEKAAATKKANLEKKEAGTTDDKKAAKKAEVEAAHNNK